MAPGSPGAGAEPPADCAVLWSCWEDCSSLTPWHSKLHPSWCWNTSWSVCARLCAIATSSPTAVAIWSVWACWDACCVWLVA